MDEGNITQAAIELAQINDTNAINHNRIIVDNIYLNTWAQDIYDLTDDQINTLADIAYLDPITDGDAVYTARVMLNLNPDNTNELKSMYYSPNDNKPQITVNNVRIYPNPAKKQFTVEFTNAIAHIQPYLLIH